MRILDRYNIQELQDSLSLSLDIIIIISIEDFSLSLWRQRQRDRMRMLFTRLLYPNTERDRERNLKNFNVRGVYNG